MSCWRCWPIARSTAPSATLRMALRKLRGGKVGTETPFDLRVVNLGFETTCVVEWMADRAPPQGDGAARERWPRSLRIFKAALETSHHRATASRCGPMAATTRR